MRKATLVQILLPTEDARGKAFPTAVIENIKDTLVGKFGGVTAFTHSPADGVWKPAGETKEHDRVVIIEVMTEELDGPWWAQFRRALEADLQQEKVVIRAHEITRL
jgi:hypothetical protein